MSVRAEAIPLEGPLEGGSEGASVVVEPIDAGRARFPRAFYEYEGGRLGGLKALGFRAGEEDYLDVPVPAYLVRHPTAGPMLIDTGLHPSVASDPTHNLGRRASKYFSLEPGGDVTSQLREKGLGPGDIAWNFTKFVVGKDGAVKARFNPRVEPNDPALRAAIDAALAE